MDGFGYLKINLTSSEQMKDIFEEQNRIFATASEFRIVCIIKKPKIEQICALFRLSKILQLVRNLEGSARLRKLPTWLFFLLLMR